MSTIDFLRPDTAQIRHQIRGILDSYSHEWDLLSELAQNSVDAIRDAGVEKGRIEISVDAISRRVSITDNGSGLDPDKVEKLLRPFGTGKMGKSNQIGEKGVGLKFIIFSSSLFKLMTESAAGNCKAVISGAAAWVQSDTESSLTLDLDRVDQCTKYGTTVEVTLADQNSPLFDYSPDEILFYLRTKTALGDTGYIWETALSADVTLIHIAKEGARTIKVFDCRYLLPTESLKASDREGLDEFREWLTVQDRSDQEKRKKLMNKVVWTKGKHQQGNRVIRYWSCFVPKREFWKKMSASVGLMPADEEQVPHEVVPGVGFTGGLQTSTKGMPTGISLEL